MTEVAYGARTTLRGRKSMLLTKKHLFISAIGICIVFIFVSFQNFTGTTSVASFRQDPAFVFPLNQVSSIPFENGVLKRTQTDNFSTGWSNSVTLLSGFRNMYNAKILKTGSTAYPYEMWFFGWATQVCNHASSDPTTFQYCDSIFYARASQIQGPWQVYKGKVNGVPQFDSTMQPRLWVPIVHGQNVYWNNWHNGDPAVVKVAGTYFMAYSVTGVNQYGRYPQIIGSDPHTAYNESIAGAYSTDGINWTKLERPLLVSPYDPMNGTTHPVNSGFARPSLMYENSKFRLWFDYNGGENGLSMGYAELPGPASIENFRNSTFSIIQGYSQPAIAQWPNPSVIRVDDLYIATGDPVSYWLQGTWVQRQVSFAISKDGLKWKVIGQLAPDTDCMTNMVPELFYEGGQIHLTTGCVRKYAPEVLTLLPEEVQQRILNSGEMSSIKYRKITYQNFRNSVVQILNQRNDNYLSQPTETFSIPSRPACVAPGTDQVYLQSAENFFAANITSNAQVHATYCVLMLRRDLLSLRSAKWQCDLTNTVKLQTQACVNSVVRAASLPYETQKYNAGNDFVTAFGRLITAKSSGATSAQLVPLISTCISTQDLARRFNIPVDQYRCL